MAIPFPTVKDFNIRRGVSQEQFIRGVSLSSVRGG